MSRAVPPVAILIGMLLATFQAFAPPSALARNGKGGDHRQERSAEVEQHERRDRFQARNDYPSRRNGGRDFEQHWQKLPEDQRDRLRDRWQRFRDLPPEQQEQLRRNYQRWQELPPDERERLQRTWRHYQELPPGRQERLKDELRSLRDLPAAERERRRQELHRSYFPDLPPPPPREVR